MIEEKEKRPEEKSDKKRFYRELIFYVAFILCCVFIIPKYVVQQTIVDGPSMEDTLYDGDHLIVEKLSYRFDDLNRFDIIAFYPQGRSDGDYYIKRIIGLPGETVQIIGSDIYINGEVLEEDYGKDPITDAGIAKDPITLGDGEYFVLGDNREVSVDSRSEDVGIVKKENIGGRAVLRIWPFSDFGGLD